MACQQLGRLYGVVVPKRSVKVMWDYDASPPLWIDTGWIGHASSDAVPIPDPLINELQNWSERMTTLMWGPNGPDARGWGGPDQAELERLNAEGLRLAVRMREALDDSWSVTYFDEFEHTEVEVRLPPTETVRRHRG